MAVYQPPASVVAPSPRPGFFARVGTFLLPVLLALCALECLLAQMPNTYAKKKQLFEAALDHIEVLVLGNSHSYTGIDPTLLRGWAFNLAIPNQPLRIDRMLLDMYGARLPRLKLVILGLSYHSVGYDLANTSESYRLSFYERVFGIPSPDPAWSLRHYSWIAVQGDPYRAGTVWWDAVHAPAEIPGFDARGKLIVKPAHPRPITAEKARDLVAYVESCQREATATEDLAGLRRVIQDLKRRGVATALVTLPVDRTYVDAVKPERFAAQQRTCAALSRETEAPYFNYFGAPGFDTTDFLDVDHLNDKGATKVTGLLDRDLARAIPAYTAAGRPH